MLTEVGDGLPGVDTATHGGGQQRIVAEIRADIKDQPALLAASLPARLRAWRRMASTAVRDESGKTPAEVARAWGHKEAAQLLGDELLTDVETEEYVLKDPSPPSAPPPLPSTPEEESAMKNEL